jgi:hypothetical protein
MHQFHHVRGIPGRLVGHPEQGGERRFIGKQKRDPDACAKLRAEGADLAELYDDVEQLVKASGHELVRLERAIVRGDLVRLADPIVAHSHAAAMEKIAATAPPPALAPAADGKSEQTAAPTETPPTAAKPRKGS